ncbi:MAG: DegV family protein [Clostridia bacterium]|nr:DegV family protein [Clostridia bacterium]
MLVLFTDTDTDMTPEVAREYGYKLISMPYSMDGKTVYPYEDSDVDFRAFYDALREGSLPTTSAISPAKYEQYFEPEFEAGNDILYVHFSRAMTATFDAMDEAVANLKKKYPERKFYEIDTKGITICSYIICLEIGDQYKAGKTAEEMMEWASREVDHFATYFFADDLKFFKRSGRVSGLAATMGTLLGVRPVIYMNEEGKMVSKGTVKGRGKAMDKLVSYVEELGDDVKAHRIVIGNTDAPELVAEMREMLINKFGPDLNVVEVTTNPTTGGHCGPNGLGLAFHCTHR